jgi:hypothetical protein
MKRLTTLTPIPIVLILAQYVLAGADRITSSADMQTSLTRGASAGKTAPLPALARGVSELKFSEFFVSPVGARGLELTDKLKGLEGRRVRILGYMVRQDNAAPGSFILTLVPAQLHDHDSALADDLPPSAVRVLVPDRRSEHIPYTPQLLLLTGTLNIGNREEADGRISIVRLTLDPQPRRARALKAEATGRGAASALMRPRNFSN